MGGGTSMPANSSAGHNTQTKILEQQEEKIQGMMQDLVSMSDESRKLKQQLFELDQALKSAELTKELEIKRARAAAQAKISAAASPRSEKLAVTTARVAQMEVRILQLQMGEQRLFGKETELQALVDSIHRRSEEVVLLQHLRDKQLQVMHVKRILQSQKLESDSRSQGTSKSPSSIRDSNQSDAATVVIDSTTE